MSIEERAKTAVQSAFEKLDDRNAWKFRLTIAQWYEGILRDHLADGPESALAEAVRALQIVMQKIGTFQEQAEELGILLREIRVRIAEAYKDRESSTAAKRAVQRERWTEHRHILGVFTDTQQHNVRARDHARHRVGRTGRGVASAVRMVF